MELNNLTAISPIDGRYWTKVVNLAEYFSEFGLIYYRILVEIEYFIALCRFIPQLKTFDNEHTQTILRGIFINFTEKDSCQIKEIENKINHDIKAIEHFIKNKFDTLGWTDKKEWVHFGLTSQDINNTAIPLSMKEAMHDIYYKCLKDEILVPLNEKAQKWIDIPMLSRTHGQPATPSVQNLEEPLDNLMRRI